MPNAAQHTIKYRKHGDYGTYRPIVVGVEYLNGFNPKMACEACIFHSGEHSDWCEKAAQLKLFSRKSRDFIRITKWS